LVRSFLGLSKRRSKTHRNSPDLTQWTCRIPGVNEIHQQTWKGDNIHQDLQKKEHGIANDDERVKIANMRVASSPAVLLADDVIS
ncbi:hypothetical protein AVEN_271375-1, partial [Araneus ventricosus]